MIKLLHNLKLINMRKTILLIAFIKLTESISFTEKFSETKSLASSWTLSPNMTENDMVIFLSTLTTAIEAIETSGYLHVDNRTINTSQLIACHGYKAEEHTVISNGYILRMFRIPGDGPSVLLMHGLLLTSNDWLVLGEKSLAIILVRLGYDVWLGNARGNTYSRKHTTISPEDPKFWDFSWHEIGTEDLPAFIDHICKTTGAPRITYVGYSQGTTSISVLLSEMPEYNKKLLGVVLLSAVTFSTNMKSPVAHLLADTRTEVELVFKFLGVYEFAPHRPPVSTLTAICASLKQLSTLCMTLIFTVVGFDYDQIDDQHIRDQFKSVPGGSSLKQIIHYLQIIDSEFFQKYDYGTEGNMEKYGCDLPPIYELENISTNVTIIYSNNDWLSNFKKDVTRMVARLPTPPQVFEVDNEMWNHVDYVWGKDADSLVYYLVQKMLKKYNS